MLDDSNILKQRDPGGALQVASVQFNQAAYNAAVLQPENDGREIKNIVVAGMGGSALAAELTKSWLGQEINVPFEIIRGYELPKYVNESTLLIASSYSGNTEETISCLEEGIKNRHSQIAIIASGGELEDIAKIKNITHSLIPSGIQPRMAMIYNLKALIALLNHFGVVDSSKLDEIEATTDWLQDESLAWLGANPVAKNLAKQIALLAVGKTPVFYAGEVMYSIAYKWKISWNENAKNVAFCNVLPEFNHNEFMGWASHPVEKPFAVFDITSREFENERVMKRFAVSDKLLSGLRPKSHEIKLVGDTPLKQMLWGCILADFASIYVAILNGVDPTPVVLIEKLKKELAKN